MRKLQISFFVVCLNLVAQVCLAQQSAPIQAPVASTQSNSEPFMQRIRNIVVFYQPFIGMVRNKKRYWDRVFCPDHG